MKTLNKKIALLILTILSVMILSVIPASATSIDTTTVNKINTTGSNTNPSNLNNTSNPAGLPEGTIEQLQSKAESKFFNIVELLQTIGKPFFIICFIVATVFTIIGCFGRGGVWKGVIGMVASGLLYACVMYAPEIVEFIQLWTIS